MMEKRVHKVLGIVTGILLAIAGICLIGACVGIYLSGNRPFSPDAVSLAFFYIQVPVYLCLSAVMAGLLLRLFLPDEDKIRPEKQHRAILRKLCQKLDLSRCEPELARSILRLRTRRLVHQIITFSLLIVCSAVFLIYALQPRFFDDSLINQSMVQAMLPFGVCLAIPFGYGVFCAYHHRRSMEKEIKLVKQAISSGCTAEPVIAEKKPNKWLWIAIKAGVCVLGLGCLIYGFCLGGFGDVLTKAVNICTECVGLG